VRNYVCLLGVSIVRDRLLGVSIVRDHVCLFGVPIAHTIGTPNRHP
jgi:hypothetical protein